MAAPGYNVGNGFAGTKQALSSTLITLVRLVVPGSSGKAAYIWEIECSQIDVPNATDCQVGYSLNHCDTTGAGTGTSATPFPTGLGSLGLATSVAVTTAKVNYTAEPTAYVQADEFWHKAVNQRNGVIWQAAPFGEIPMVTTASTGPGLRGISSNYTGTAYANMKFSEI